MTPEELNWILDWAYLHQIDLNKENVTDVIILANYVDAPELMSTCINFIIAEASMMYPSELEDLKVFAKEYQIFQLEETVTQLILESPITKAIRRMAARAARCTQGHVIRRTMP